MIASGRFTVTIAGGGVVVGCGAGPDDALAFHVTELPTLLYVLTRALATECEVCELPDDGDPPAAI